MLEDQSTVEAFYVLTWMYEFSRVSILAFGKNMKAHLSQTHLCEIAQLNNFLYVGKWIHLLLEALYF